MVVLVFGQSDDFGVRCDVWIFWFMYGHYGKLEVMD